MAESNSLEKVNIEPVEIARTDVMTGDKDKRLHLYYQLIHSMEKADSIDIIVSFLIESGVRLLLRELKKALARGSRVRILTGNYLGITQPSALYLVKHELKDSVDLRFYNEKDRSFHPKSYIFHYKDHSDIYIGSSNISRSALTSGIEWNYRFSSLNDRESYERFFRTFEDLFVNHSIVIDDEVLKDYSRNWHRPAAAKDLEKYDESEQDSDSNIIPFFEPRGAQIEALCALENARAEGASKALVTAATGIGKTALAAFDSRAFERILFVAHREEILRQAADTFRRIRNSDDIGFFDGRDKCTEQPVIFASVATLGNSRYLTEEYFSPDRFQYLIVDEMHHGVTEQYKRIVAYFKPQFMLGLTATPERLDGKNIYELCDYNVPYEITLHEAINKGMLVPFHYYGIYDNTDYSKIQFIRGKYSEAELTEAYSQNTGRYELIYKYYCKYGSKRALGFCCSRMHAERMAREFSKRGIPALAVYSDAEGEFSEEREIAIQKLKRGNIRVIFSVDMFNEGVDIPSVDMVMFLRPTESPIVFLQQLGRGLRKDRGKDFLNVLDFIGNYEKAGRVRFYLSGRAHEIHGQRTSASNLELPDGCIADFDMRLIDLFHEMDKKQYKLRDQIRNEYYRVKELLGHRPSRMELFTYMDDDVYRLAIMHSKENPFKRYLDYLDDLGELTNEDMSVFESIGREFINIVETTAMTKVYKMPILMAFFNSGNMLMRVSEEQLLKSWKDFFNTGTNWKDLDKDITYEKYLKITDEEHIRKIFQMPVHFLQESGKGFFVKENGCALALRKEMGNIVKDENFMRQFKDVIDYRTMDYYRRRYQGAGE